MFIGGRVGDLRARTETTSGLYTACFELGGPRPTVGVPEGELAEVLRDGMRRTILWGIQARQVVPRTWVRSSLTRLITERLRPDRRYTKGSNSRPADRASLRCQLDIIQLDMASRANARQNGAD